MSALPIVPAETARTLLLGAQGLLDDPGRPASPAKLAALIEQLGFVQLDSINVVERAQHLTLSARLQGYRPEHLAHLLEKDRSLFEHWTHDASAIPTRWYGHWKPRFARASAHIRRSTWWNERIGPDADKVVAHVRDRIRAEGPLRSVDFEHDRQGEKAGWWGWKPQKAALEFLWRSGELAIAGRQQFQKLYDLSERVHPQAHAGPAPSEAEHLEWACSTALERLGVATPSELAAYWRSIDLADAKQWCERAAKAGLIAPVRAAGVDGEAKPAFALPDWQARAARLPAPPPVARLLAPFDPVLRDRKRALRLFGFDYRFEAFVPEAKRKHGYYVLPLLVGDRLVGRVDPKLDRAKSTLVISRAWWEKGHAPAQRRAWLEEAGHGLGTWLGAKKVQLPRGR